MLTFYSAQGKNDTSSETRFKIIDVRKEETKDNSGQYAIGVEKLTVTIRCSLTTHFSIVEVT